MIRILTISRRYVHPRGHLASPLASAPPTSFSANENPSRKPRHAPSPRWFRQKRWSGSLTQVYLPPESQTAGILGPFFLVRAQLCALPGQRVLKLLLCGTGRPCPREDGLLNIHRGYTLSGQRSASLDTFFVAVKPSPSALRIDLSLINSWGKGKLTFWGLENKIFKPLS